MYRLVRALVDSKASGQRLDAYLAALPDSPSRSACVRVIETGEVSINGTPALSKSERVMVGDRVEACFVEDEPTSGRLLPNPDIELDVRFEDDFLLVISKQAGLVCHPSPGHAYDTLANALVARCGYDHLGMLQGEDRPGIVHRLDMDTSGLMLVAKDDTTQQALQDLIRLRILDRRYVTLVHGYVASEQGTITTGIARSSRDRLRMTVSDDPLAREAITTYKVLEHFEAGPRDEGYTLLECHLYTGRTHQIRVHMRHQNHPVVGDPLYGVSARKGRDRGRDLGLRRQFLHSWRIAFDHPKTREHLVFADGLPADLRETLQLLERRSMGRTEAGEDICSRLMA